MLLTIAGNTYNYPDPGTDPGWGSEATDWAAAVTEVLASFLGPGDILPTDFAIVDDTQSSTDVVGLTFDGALVRAANVTYAVVRGPITQTGTLYLSYNGAAAAGSQWTLAEQLTNDAGVRFSITDAGQVQYIASSTGTNGQMRFSAKTLGT